MSSSFSSSSFLRNSGWSGSSSSLLPTKNLAPHFLIFHFVLAYALMSTRGVKNYYRMDHNSSPRQDTTKYGEKMVSSGKMKRSTLDRLVRWENAHANSVENYPLFVAGVLLALHAHLPTAQLNSLMTTYTLSRIGFGVSYIVISSMTMSWIRTIFWWSGNIACLRMLWLSAARLESFA